MSILSTHFSYASKKCKHVSCVRREQRIVSPACVSPPTCFWAGIRWAFFTCFTPTCIGQAPKFVVLHFPSPFSPLKSWVISYQQKCEACQRALWLPARSPCSTELRSRFSLSSSSFTSWARGPHPQHSDHFSFMSASSETVFIREWANSCPASVLEPCC